MNRMTRKAVIGELRELKHMFQRRYDKYPTCLEEAIDYIDQTPQPERKKGKWIIVTDSRGQHAECPYCGEWKYHLQQKFCGECGARMEEQDEHTD